MAFDGRLLAGVSVLTAVVESGSFVRAGEALGLTPSGVSRAVVRLEVRVGVRLLDRSRVILDHRESLKKMMEQPELPLTGWIDP